MDYKEFFTRSLGRIRVLGKMLWLWEIFSFFWGH